MRLVRCASFLPLILLVSLSSRAVGFDFGAGLSSMGQSMSNTAAIMAAQQQQHDLEMQQMQQQHDFQMQQMQEQQRAFEAQQQQLAAQIDSTPKSKTATSKDALVLRYLAIRVLLIRCGSGNSDFRNWPVGIRQQRFSGSF
jgi:hypothetical protein